MAIHLIELTTIVLKDKSKRTVLRLIKNTGTGCFFLVWACCQINGFTGIQVSFEGAGLHHGVGLTIYG